MVISKSKAFILCCLLYVFLTIHLTPSQKSNSYQIKHRIVSLSPATTEMLFDLQLGHLIVGTTEYSNHPKAAQKIQRIGPYQRPSLEMILALKPTIVVAVSEGVDTISSTLKKAKIPMIVLDTKSLLDFEKNIKTLAKTFSIENQGEALIQKWQKNWRQIPNFKRHIKVIIQVDQNPLILAGQQTHLNELIKKCGGQNVFQETGYQKVSRETIAGLKPKKILTFGQLGKAMTKTMVINYWKSYPALKNINVQFFNPDHVSRLTLHLSAMAAHICKKIRL